MLSVVLTDIKVSCLVYCISWRKSR